MSGAPDPERDPALPLLIELRELCHALSQPLTAARGSLELGLSLPDDDPSRLGFFTDALDALDRLAEISRRLNDLAGGSTRR